MSEQLVEKQQRTNATLNNFKVSQQTQFYVFTSPPFLSDLKIEIWIVTGAKGLCNIFHRESEISSILWLQHWQLTPLFEGVDGRWKPGALLLCCLLGLFASFGKLQQIQQQLLQVWKTIFILISY